MALTNRERIDRAAGALAGVLGPALDRTIAGQIPPGTTWVDLFRIKDTGGSEREYSHDDVRLQLRALTENFLNLRRPFSSLVNRAEENLAGELREVLNKWAHREPFNTDDTYRALDTTERLLRVLDAPQEARQVAAMRQELLRVRISDEARTDTRKDVDLADVELPAWHEVLTPHPDVLNGRFQESEFAANLHSVATGTGDVGHEYSDPVEFFRRTYLTEGLKDLLSQAVQRIAGTGTGTGGSPIVNLQSTFGGGKTHSMLAVWHLFSGVSAESLPDDVQSIVKDAQLDRLHVNRAAIVGNEIAPGSADVKDDGTEVRTLWGELALQLGGKRGYALVADADRTATSPGSGLRRLIADAAPCVILIDEWVAYARQLLGRDDLPGGTFDTQFTFAQQLSEVVSTTPGALLLVSIPASDIRTDTDGNRVETPASELETGGANGHTALQKLEHVIGRVAHQWQPASNDESFEIVRRRLFREPDGDAQRRINQTARRFVNLYRETPGLFPQGADTAEYERRIRRAFPIHPELFDRLYEDWSTLERFQRTRGVLRLMSTVIAELVKEGDNSPIIMPGTIPIGAAGVTSEFASYVDAAWRGVISADVDGPQASARAVDEERPVYGRRALSTRLARALFLGSAPTVGGAHAGLDRKDLTLGVVMPGDTVRNADSALALLQQRSAYIFQDGERYWLDVTPSLNRIASERAAALDAEDVEAAIIERLRARSRDTGGLFKAVIVAPDSGSEIPEDDETRLIVLGPGMPFSARSATSEARDAVIEMTKNRGATPREYRNTLVFVAPDSRRVDDLRSAMRAHLAWKGIRDDADRLDLRQEQMRTAAQRSDDENKRVESLISDAWTHGLTPHQTGNNPEIEVRTFKLDTSEPRLHARAEKGFTRDDELVAGTYGPRVILMNLERYLARIWNKGYISARELYELHAKYLYLPRLRSIQVLYRGLDDATGNITGDVFWLADGYDEATGDFEELVGPTSGEMVVARPETLLVSQRLAEAQVARQKAAEETRTGHDEPGPSPLPGGGTGPGDDGDDGRDDDNPPTPQLDRNAAYHGTFEIDAGGDVEGSLAEIADAIITQLRDAGPDSLEVTMTVESHRAGGFPEGIVRAVRENGRGLGAAKNRFEDE
ncbi:DUF499 domain-containing protein [Acidipropionibacterium acidipropionici]|uniref:DUF499 domain-containing protein n=1 Tax=Acidipropionibacterium acidipropionici TaxID=1748 RepID=UPI000418C1D1|nr:DUF499 domain-containing protein [Acidipropionibacterium acidipropionici]ALN14480.1 hypothetical protein ASQ49_03440 [Acidipropionibacterium acidipropionici]APZ09759.1 hypothetical protein BWX38_11485 [Acidipropionibacterium acidipropionici]